MLNRIIYSMTWWTDGHLGGFHLCVTAADSESEHFRERLMMWSSAGISHIRLRDQYVSLNQVDGLQRKKGKKARETLKVRRLLLPSHHFEKTLKSKVKSHQGFWDWCEVNATITVFLALWEYEVFTNRREKTQSVISQLFLLDWCILRWRANWDFWESCVSHIFLKSKRSQYKLKLTNVSNKWTWNITENKETIYIQCREKVFCPLPVFIFGIFVTLKRFRSSNKF